jgi:NADH:ubiquinone oxidoreductase subunit F (NADH-binding)/NADH:ubiquinone oxidoreductase subunit E
MIVQRLHVIQEKYGYLPDAELEKVAAEIKPPHATRPLYYPVQEVASFFPHFRQQWDRPKAIEVRVCRDMACHLKGSADLLHRNDPDVEKLIKAGELAIEGVSCLGRCDRAPACLISRYQRKPGPAGADLPLDEKTSFHDRLYVNLTRDGLAELIRKVAAGGDAPAASDAGYSAGSAHEAWHIDVYRQRDAGGKPRWRRYEATRQFLRLHRDPIPRIDPPAFKGDPPPFNPALVQKRVREGSDQERDGRWKARYQQEQRNRVADAAYRERHPLLMKIKDAELLGMGGAGRPVFQKWFDVWQAEADTRYVVCNGDESEPATFKDRELLVKTPHLVVEGVLLGVLMTNATAGYIFIRHEYQEQIEACRAEIALARIALADDFVKAGRAFPRLEVFVSPGGYICGEQGALLEAMEGRRAQPRHRPPEPSTNGLYEQPTALNNVESLAWVPAIVLSSGEWYVEGGRCGGRGRRLFSICGDVGKPGVYEVGIGTTLGELIELAGGVAGDLQAVATSGPSGGFLPARLPVPWPVGSDAKDNDGAVAEWAMREKIDDLLLGDKYLLTDGTRLPAGDLLRQFAEERLYPCIRRAEPLPVTALPLDLNFFRDLAGLLDWAERRKPVPKVVRDVPKEVQPLLGAGLVVYNRDRDLLAAARNCTQFFRNESCGKCVPCRLGSHQLVGIGTALLGGRPGARPKDEDRDAPAPPKFMEDVRANVLGLAEVLGWTSICSLGKSVTNPLATLFAFFWSDYDLTPPTEAGHGRR